MKATLLITGLIFSTACFSQVKVPKKETVKQADTSFTISGKVVYDTVKVKVILWADDGSDLSPLVYKKAYIVTKSIVVPGNSPINGGNELYDEKFVKLNYKEQDIADIKMSKW